MLILMMWQCYIYNWITKTNENGIQMSYSHFLFVIMTKTSLDATTRSHLKDWLKNQKQPNNFPRPFIFKKFITIKKKILMFKNCMH
jgi:hypothetical protein